MTTIEHKDYSNIATIPGAVTELTKSLILSKRENVSLAREFIFEHGQQSQFIKILKARLITYYSETRKYLEIYFPKENAKIKKSMESEILEDLLNAFDLINDCIFKLGIIDNNQEIIL